MEENLYSTQFSVINGFLDKDELIVVTAVCNKIIEAGATLRVGNGITISKYFHRLEKGGLVRFDCEKEGYFAAPKLRELFPVKTPVEV